MTFDKLLKTKIREDVKKQVASGFHDRQSSRDKAYSKKAKSQAPTDKFFSRSYNL